MKIWQGACIVHATFPARRLAEARAEASASAGRRASRVPAGRARAWPISSAPLPPSSTGARIRADGIHRDDRKRRAPFARKARARQALLLRPQRKLQLQRVSVHEAEHARKAARRAARLEPRVELSAEIDARAPAFRSSACWRCPEVRPCPACSTPSAACTTTCGSASPTAATSAASTACRRAA